MSILTPNPLADLDATLTRVRWEAIVLLGVVCLIVLDLQKADTKLRHARSDMVLARGRAERAEDARDAHKETIDKLLEELHARGGEKPAHESEP